MNTLDSVVGDGDCGSTFKRVAEILNHKLDISSFRTDSTFAFLMQLSELAQRDMGGTSGGLYSVFFAAAASKVRNDCSLEYIGQAFRAGVEAIEYYGGAKLGDRTMLDALIPCLDCFKENSNLSETLQELMEKVDKGINCTINLKAKAGRAAYTHTSQHDKPDAGAYAIGLWIKSLCKHYLNN